MWGLVVLGLGAAAVAVGLRDWVGLLVGGVYVASTVAALAFTTRAGHRGSCRVRRGVRTGLAALGLPLRVVTNLV